MLSVPLSLPQYFLIRELIYRQGPELVSKCLSRGNCARRVAFKKTEALSEASSESASAAGCPESYHADTAQHLQSSRPNAKAIFQSRKSRYGTGPSETFMLRIQEFHVFTFVRSNRRHLEDLDTSYHTNWVVDFVKLALSNDFIRDLFVV